MTLTVTEHSDVNRPRHRAALLSLLILIGALVTYKTATALRVIERVKAGGAIPATSVTAGLDIVSRAIDYLAVIWPALATAAHASTRISSSRRSTSAANGSCA